MKPFLCKLALFLCISLLAWHLKALYLIGQDRYKKLVAGSEIYVSIQKSKKKNKSKKILIGDSVAKQLFNNYTNNNGLNSLACNQAISMAGHYFLLKNYLEAGNTPDTVFLMYGLPAFRNNLDQVFTYHYFLKPFYTDEYKAWFTQTVNNQIKKIPYYWASQLPESLTCNWAPDFTNRDEKDTTMLLSSVSLEYLLKIKELSGKYHFKCLILPDPVAESTRQANNKLNRTQIATYNLTEEFSIYFEKMIYLNDNLFLDGIHLKNPAPTRTYYKKLMLI